ncbi:bifunctional 4-hydroxy-2-oxoglutarate aldolase/2-dehydro-3-deoxy-phosphogluconate aldolase [Limnofasciculus baicalensis]|uniref:Bifunctional 4-hydroxy-2-oxoglutarate aldolase/2-dehydro-3-deoxy-phosphogluconate aldolase n=1 Tax=Limnofasciculus baicalensis BBK-W-15 TaxID=2699891 RepID=A0AAE3GNM5_9CYAN|nr:bifunctional 4-hydroxy-2-oxoglutarate aldolase/2-dehydro-3-deoxy-phosphogluconate aldolase [Limnofasciculus baicalensis]MCP2727254.1 bifunctional 4-hydroxy-2-oxoglutarate aldolase/2-dehydro-3-deoxy-phosphogluconate aldolase [Limnofasciculus baicalensis BBK-W-15]
MSNQSWLAQLQQDRGIAVIRAHQYHEGYLMALSVAAGGISLIEITWNSDRAPELIHQLRGELPHCRIGTGTLLNLAQLREAVDAGAQFLFTPHVDITLIRAAEEADIPIVPGALSPTEIIAAMNAGASCVKVFPIQAVGGVNYIKALQGPLGHIPLIPTGGVNLGNAKEFIKAGAIAVGLSGDLFPKALVEAGNWDGITQLAKNLREQIANG